MRTQSSYVAVYAAVLLATVCVWPSRVLGDGREYLVMADHLSRLQPPSLTLDEARALGMRDPLLDTRHGRQELLHFWLYSAVCAPVVSLFRWARVQETLAFAVVNIVALSLAAVAAAAVLDLSRWVLLLISPVIWWTSVVHADAFLYALLVGGFGLAARGSPLAPVPVGVAAAQNPGLAPLILIVSAYGAMVNPVRRAPLLTATGLALLIFALHPAYYFHSLGRPTALITADGVRVPGLQLLTYVLIDLNVGALVQFPFLLIIMALAVIRGLRRDGRAVALGVASTLLILFAAAQVGNVNHGATPGMSRYALWLLPPWIPALSGLGAGQPRGVMASGVDWCSAVWCLAFFNPLVPENTLHPTRTAMFVWTHYPSLENPLPQIFSERVRHAFNVRPAATPRCEKALLYEGKWPEGCQRTLVPAACARQESWCYANRTGAHAYEFVVTFRNGKYLPVRRALRQWNLTP